MQVTAILMPAEEGGYVGHNPDTGIACQGQTVEEALINLREAVERHLQTSAVTFYGAPLVTTIEVSTNA